MSGRTKDNNIAVPGRLVVISSIDDLLSAAAACPSQPVEIESDSSSQVETIHFQIDKTQLPLPTFRRFVALFCRLATQFHHVTRVVLDADLYWTRTTTRDFLTQLAMLPQLKSFTWVSTSTGSSSASDIPIPLLTIVCTHGQGLEQLVLDGLHFLTSSVYVREEEEEVQERIDAPQDNGDNHQNENDDLDSSQTTTTSNNSTTTRTRHVSETLVPLHHALRTHPTLRLFQCVHCAIAEVQNNRSNGTSSTHNNYARILMDRLWIDELLKSLAYVTTLECMDIRVLATTTPSVDGRILLGLCKQGDIATAAMRRLTQQILQMQIQPGHTCRGPYQKMRLWIADSYHQQQHITTDDQPQPDLLLQQQQPQTHEEEDNQQLQKQQLPSEQQPSQLLLNICRALVHNTFLKNLRVRGSTPAAAPIYINPPVVAAFQELLESGKNYALTCCDLMNQQGKQIDFYCRLNRLDRGPLMKQIQTMDQRDWIEDILLPFGDDLDALYYWNRLNPVLLTSHIGVVGANSVIQHAHDHPDGILMDE